MAGRRLHNPLDLSNFPALCQKLVHESGNPPELAARAELKVHVQFEKCQYPVPFRLVERSLWLPRARPATGPARPCGLSHDNKIPHLGDR